MPEEEIPEESIMDQILRKTLEYLSTKTEFPDELIVELRSLALSGKFSDAPEIRRVLE